MMRQTVSRAVTDAMGNRRTYTYNAGGKIETITDFDGMQAAFTYNPLGKVESTTQTRRDTGHALPMTGCGTSVP